MNVSEIIIILLIYSGLFIYFVMPFYNKPKEKPRLFPIKSVFALIMYVLTIVMIWGTYKAEEWHVNEHSGNPPISLTNEALFLMISVSIYTILLFIVVAFFNMKKSKSQGVPFPSFHSTKD